MYQNSCVVLDITYCYFCLLIKRSFNAFFFVIYTSICIYMYNFVPFQGPNYWTKGQYCIIYNIERIFYCIVTKQSYRQLEEYFFFHNSLWFCFLSSSLTFQNSLSKQYILSLHKDAFNHVCPLVLDKKSNSLQTLRQPIGQTGHLRIRRVEIFLKYCHYQITFLKLESL